MSRPATDTRLQDHAIAIQKRLVEGLARLDPHRHLQGRPATFQVIAGQTLEITYHDVMRLDDAELEGVRNLLGPRSAYSIAPQTAETMTVRFVVPLKSREGL